MNRIVPTLLIFAPAAIAAPTTFNIGAGTHLDARLFKAGIGSALAHDHVIRAGDVRGTVRYNPETESLLAVTIEVQARSLVADAPRVRHEYGLPNDIDADDRAEINKNMRSADQLAVGRYPTMAFSTVAVQAFGAGKFQLSGKLTIRGQTRDVALPIQIERKGTALSGTGALRIRHTQFGFEPYSAALGAVKNKDRIDLRLTVKARASAPPAAPKSTTSE